MDNKDGEQLSSIKKKSVDKNSFMKRLKKEKIKLNEENSSFPCKKRDQKIIFSVSTDEIISADQEKFKLLFSYCTEKKPVEIESVAVCLENIIGRKGAKGKLIEAVGLEEVLKWGIE